MKYGILFLILGLLIGGFAIQNGGWSLLLLWPAANCVIIGIAYFARIPQLFGKRPNGSLNPLTTIVLLPYLFYLWLIWHILRLIQSENAYDNLNDRLTIGRRLLYSEMPSDVQNVIDLTCEFSEPTPITTEFNYLSFPILDASVPALVELRDIVQKIDSLDGRSYIHCAQGHGRTGLLTAALLLKQNPDLTVDDAIEKIKSVRPALRCNREQMQTLHRFAG